MSASTVLAVREQTSKPSGPTRVPASRCNQSSAYLRAFIVLLVVAHHAVLAYFRFAPPPSSLTALPRIWRAFPGANRRPMLFFVVLTVLFGAAYLPLAVRLNPFAWSAWAPVAFQTSRALHYLVYSFLGMGIGAYGPERGFLARDGKLRRRWWLWCLASLVAFAVGTGVGMAAMTMHLGSRASEIAGDSTFVLFSAASSFAFLALFVRFGGKRSPIFDSRHENAYGIYLVHYAFVSWMQLALLKLDLPAVVKAAMAFAAAGFLSWGTAALIGRIPLGQPARRAA